MASVLYSNSGKKLITTNSLWFLDIDHYSLSNQQYNLGFSVASFILLSLTPTFSQAELLSVVELKAVGVFSVSVGRPSPEHAPSWVAISLGLLPGSTRASCWTVGSAAPLCSADINCINPQGQWMTHCTVEYKFRMLQKKIPKYSRRLRRIEVLNCCLSTSHILIINLCVDTWFFSDIWIRYAAFFCVSEYI